MQRGITVYGTKLDHIHDAKRALYMITAVPTDVASCHLHGKPPTGSLLQEVGLINSLPYRHRRERWTRLQIPVMKTNTALETEVTTNSDPYKIPTQLANSISLKLSKSVKLKIPKWYRRLVPLCEVKAAKGKVKAKPSTQKPPSPILLDAVKVGTETIETLASKLWCSNEEVTMSATIGQVLHRAQPDTISQPTTHAFNPANSTFLPTVPKLPLLLPHLPNCSEEKIVKDTLSFRLIQDTWLSKSGKYFPEIRMEFKVSSLGEKAQTAEFSGMYAIIGNHNAYAMLPYGAVDACFGKRMVIRMDPEGIEANEKIKAYIETTKQNILGPGALRAPQQINIPLPVWTIDGIERPSKKRKTKPKAVVSDAVNIAAEPKYLMGNYCFVGVEHRETLSFEYRGFDLRYDSVEAGKMGGHYGALTIMSAEMETRTGGLDSQPATDIVNEQKGFVKTAFELVGLVEQAVRGELGVGAGQIKKEIVQEKRAPKYWTKPENSWDQGKGESEETVKAAAVG
jgi:hypothetical protein